MFDKKAPIFMSVNFLLLIGIVFYLFVNHNKSSGKTRFVDSTRLFNEFNMSKESRRLGENQVRGLSMHIDSLYYRLATEGGENTKRILVNEITESKLKLQNFSNQYVDTETKKIWTRINSYASEYCQEKSYTLLIGSQRKGDVLYYEKESEVTDELLAYINKKYEGSN